MPPKQHLAWLDLETSGFTELFEKKVYEHKILEIALIVTDYKLKEVARLNLVVHQDIPAVLPLCNDVVVKMHTANGLFVESGKSTLSLQEAEQKAIEFLIENEVGVKASPLCGNGIQFDRMFLEAQMPALNDHFHYRNMDISAMKEFIKTITPGLEPVKKRAHRAMDDILESLSEAKHYRGILKPALDAAKRAMLTADALQP